MKKFFFLTCMILLIPVFSYASTYRSSVLGHAAFNQDIHVIALTKFCDKYIKTNKLSPQVVVFHLKRVRQIPEPIIKYEALETLKKIASTPVVSPRRNVALLILTTILLFLTIARRRQLEQLQSATSAY